MCRASLSCPYSSNMSVDVTGLLAAYLTATPSARLDLHAANPDVFSDEVLLELAEAEGVMTETDMAVRDIHGTFSALVTDLSLPGLTSDGASSVPCDAMFAHHFNQRLAELFAAVWHGRVPVGPEALRRVRWHEARGVMDSLFAFMPVMELLCVAENTCRPWRMHLRNGVAQPLWIGCVQREFPQALGTLIAAEGSKLLETDWRTIAMLVVSGDDGD